MARVRIWVSNHHNVGSMFIINHDDGQEECFPLVSPPALGAKVGTRYSGEFRGHEGTYHDLPRGFPMSRDEAIQRLSDPSIPGVMQKLIRENFGLQMESGELVAAR